MAGATKDETKRVRRAGGDLTADTERQRDAEGDGAAGSATDNLEDAFDKAEDAVRRD